MKKLKSSEIRQMWLDFFSEKGHSVEPSSPLIPLNDPTLLWINAGVAPLKKYFDGREKPRNPRITNAQKCIRTNDIENVGKTARHHIFFEMLGNFSIGDYFKDEAIEFAFELLTSDKWFAMPLDKLYFTVYTGDKRALDKWLSLGVSKEHIIPLDSNFWEIGQGPCGPDTEIFFDRGEKFDKRGKELIEQDIENDRYIEIWNIVFSQYNSTEGLERKNYPELPSKNIDTGCGLERMACVMQGVDTNYDTDLFMPLIKKTEEISNVKYDGQMAFKVIADHIRTVTFAISDGATLSNEGRGYVLRRVLRRATKYAKKLGINYPFMYLLVDEVIENMKDFYPYLVEKSNITKMIVKREEEKFLQTLGSGEKKLDEIIKNSKEMITGVDAFTLFDTYGFPIELTLESAEEAGLMVDINGFNCEMEKQKERARKARGCRSSMENQNDEFLKFNKESVFVGRDVYSCEAKVIAVFDLAIVLDKTPFYATSGGQVFDHGTISGVEVVDVIKMPNGQTLHYLNENPFKVNDIVIASINHEEREAIMKNHTAAHLFHKALKETLGAHVHQQGQQITPLAMRFDFNNYTNLKDDEILEIERKVNEAINASYDVITKELPIEEAKKTKAEALFGEKYGDIVRVVDMTYSIEFCGGTHVKNTMDLVSFYITSIESIGSGIFRCVAVTGDNAFELLKQSVYNIEEEITQLTKKAMHLIENTDLTFEVQTINEDQKGYAYILAKRKELSMIKQQLKQIEKDIKKVESQNVLSNLKEFDKYLENNMIICKVTNMEINILKQLVDALLNKIGNGLVFIATVNADKVVFVCKNNINKDAGRLVKEAAILTDGNGGGRKDMAQAGGKNIHKVDEALNKVKELLK